MDQRDTSFKDLMDGVRAGSEEAACELLTTYGPSIMTVVRRYLHERLRTRYDSRDFEQDVWASFFAAPPSPDKVDRPEALLTFLMAMARNKVVDAMRKGFQTRKRNVNREFSLDGSAAEAAERVPTTDPTPSATAAAHDRWEQLPERDRRIVELLLEGQRKEDVARELEISTKTVDRIFRKFFFGDPS